MNFRIRNFEKFQHYKTRRPPWIKLYAALLQDPDFGMLSDETKYHLMGIWLLASQIGNALPYDEKWIGGHIGATTPVNLEILVSRKYLILLDKKENASKLLEQNEKHAIPETETETENREKVPRGLQDLDKTSSLGDELKYVAPKRVNVITHQDKFEIFWNSKPPAKAGRHNRYETTRAWNARLKQSVNPDDLIKAMRNYAIDKADGDPQYVKGAQVFIGAAGHWRAFLEAPVKPKSAIDEWLESETEKEIKNVTP